MAFLPLLQVKQGDAASAARDASNFIKAIEVRTTGDPTAVVGQVRQALAEIDPDSRCCGSTRCPTTSAAC